MGDTSNNCMKSIRHISSKRDDQEHDIYCEYLIASK